jgi:hypothetical protein
MVFIVLVSRKFDLGHLFGRCAPPSSVVLRDSLFLVDTPALSGGKD